MLAALVLPATIATATPSPAPSPTSTPGIAVVGCALQTRDGSQAGNVAENVASVEPETSAYSWLLGTLVQHVTASSHVLVVVENRGTEPVGEARIRISYSDGNVDFLVLKDVRPGAIQRATITAHGDGPTCVLDTVTPVGP